MNKGLRMAAVWSAIAAAFLIDGGLLYAALTATFDLGAALSIVSGVISAGVSVLLARHPDHPGSTSRKTDRIDINDETHEA